MGDAGKHDPNAADTSTADQSVIGQIDGEQQQSDALIIQRAMATAAGSLNPTVEIAEQVTTAVGMGGGFVFTPEEVQHLLNETQALRHDLQSCEQKLNPFKFMDLAPAQDQAGSVMQANAVKRSFANLEVLIDSQIGYLISWMNALSNAKQNYMATEHLTEAQWDRLAQGLGS